MATRTNIAIFIHTLHLLNLDLVPTWPEITESTLSTSAKTSTSTLQSRIKATEWSLYHLFNICSSSETSSRLGAFWPANAPLQSKNLRAACFKWLSELKANGMLPREVMLRKTMLDECKGEKFEELLARFAMVVLRKHVFSTKSEEGRVRFEKIGKEQDPEKLTALILSYRSSLQGHLVRRQDLNNRALEYASQLDKVERYIDESMQRLESQDTDAPQRSQRARDELRTQVELAFADHRQWARYISAGTSDVSTLSGAMKLPLWPFDVASATSDNVEEHDVSVDINAPMTALMRQLSTLEARLKEWKIVEQSLNADETDREQHVIEERQSSKSEHLAQVEESGPARLRFDRHQELVL